MTFATRLTKVRDRSEHFDERTGMCYHQAPPLERVVMHVRDAEQAKPHLEHNPLSLLGACYATPRSLSEKEPVYQSIVAVSRVKGDNDSSLLLSLFCSSQRDATT